MNIKKLLVRSNRQAARGAWRGLVAVLAIGVAACAPSPEPTHQTVEYYRANRDAREAKLAECENDPGALGRTPDCVNAKHAARQDVKSLRDLAPLNLPGAVPNEASREPDGLPSGAENAAPGARQ